MKKIIKSILAAALCMTLGACSSKSSTTASSSSASGSAASSHEKWKIGVLEVQLNDESTNRAEYFNNYIAPQYNVEFVFSEAITSLDAAITFIENCADSGCKGIINYYAVGANSEQLARLCQEKGMTYVENGGVNAANKATYSANYDNFAGGFMADQPNTGKLFQDYLKSTLDATKTHGFLICTGQAYQGNAQQLEISTGMMTAIQDAYGLKFDKSIEELVTSADPIEATNNKGLSIYCYPAGDTVNGWLEGLAAALATGKYDYLLTSYNAIGKVRTVLSEAEAAMNKDITWIGFGTFGEALTSALNSKDQFGNQTLAMSTVKFTSLVSAMGFAKVYNNLTGHQDLNVTDGASNVYLFRMQAVTSPDQLTEMATWDKDGKWVGDYDVVNSLLGDYTSDLTPAKVQDNINAVTYESIKARLK